MIHLNLVIADFNLKLKKDFSHLKCKPLSKVDPRKFKKIIDEFKGKGELAMNTPEKKQFDLKTRLELQTVIFEFRNFPENFKNLFSPFYLRRGEPKANKLDKETVISAFDLFSIGYPQYSLLVICKSLEDRIKKYLFQLKKKGKIKIKLSELKEFDYDTMVNFLNKQKFITPSQHSKLLSIKWARNRIVHPSIRNHWSESKYDSEALIKLAINLLVDFHYKLKK